MQRGYNQNIFLKKVDIAKNIIHDVSLTTDVIVGFPGETSEDFDATLKVLEYSQFDAVYMFKFSPRPGTKASEYKDEFIENDIINDRFMRLKNLQTQISHDRFKRFIGTEQMLLIENYSKKNNDFMTGKINGGQTTHISSNNVEIGDYVKVLITEATPFALKSSLI